MEPLRAQKRRIFHEEHSHLAHLPKKFLSERLADDIRLLNIASPRGARE
eukprot:CAMPEP_0203819770 /NCGR_PEP_ID=MMETSP0115-20131106/37409_1 /ASSEMBLY_ACC=CAM_ASM_000227 /TAXON_ID=33651 /ORGANISM="Bicosoecid sp, Strain ms1" /LENGTH=48 /DNA_ID= /DNA_START= /DNA_END= /DNA_ORIENTATION=